MASPIDSVPQHGIPTDILDDLSSRFIINVPQEERKDVVRICFQIELAHWFYLDVYCTENAILRPCGIREFARIIFNHVPSLKEHACHVQEIVERWKEYKMAVPTYGAIMLDEKHENVLLVQSYFAKASWGFPKGKVNEEEEPHDCAVREVLEETGFDISQVIDREDFIEHYVRDQLVRLYVISGISMETHFEPKTKNEIKSLQWFLVSSLPTNKNDPNCRSITNYASNAFFMVIPFVRHIRKWIAGQQQKKHQQRVSKSSRRQRSKTTSDSTAKSPSFGNTNSRDVQQNYVALPYKNSECSKGSNRSGVHVRSKTSTYSPPPRLAQKARQWNELEWNWANTQTKKLSGKSLGSKDANKRIHKEDVFCPKAWSNFRFDRSAIFKSLSA